MRATRSYEIFDRIGAGGMAEVFRARAYDPQGAVSWVVVKRILPHLSHDETYVRMFFDEARIAEALESPEIVRLVDFGRMDGQLFIAFELVDGADLRVLAKRARDFGSVPFPIALHIVGRLLDGLEYAHTRTSKTGAPLAIVHRDVSLGNVLLSRKGDVKLADFGVAKAATRSTRTTAGVVKGNLHFMAPEQLGGVEVDARADVYGAGMILYVLLAGRHPFQDDPISQVISRALRGDVPAPSTVNPAIPPLVEQAVVRATRLWPGFRFPSAKDFRAALDDAAAKEGLVPASSAEIARWVTLLLGSDGEAPKTASMRLSRVVQVSDISEYRLEVALADVGGTPTELSRTPAAAPAAAPSVDPTRLSAAPPREDPTRLSAVPASAPSTEATTEKSPFGVVVGSIEEDVTTAKTQAPPIATVGGWLLGHRGAVSALALDAANGLLASASHDRTVKIWDLRARRELDTLKGHEAAVTSAVFCGPNRLLTAGRDKMIRVWDVARARELNTLEGHDGWIFALAASPDGRFVASAANDRTVRVWDLSNAEPPKVLEGHRDVVTSVAFLPGARVISGSYDRSLRVWSLRDGSVRVLEGESDSIRALAVSEDGTVALSGGADALIRTWDLALGSERRYLLGHQEPVVALALSPDKRVGLSGGYDRTVRLWDVARREELRTYQGHTEAVLSVVFGPGVFLSGGSDGRIGIWIPPS